MVFLACGFDHSICGLFYLLILYLATDTSHRYAQIRLCLKCLEDSKIIIIKCFRLIFLITGWEGYNNEFNVSWSLNQHHIQIPKSNHRHLKATIIHSFDSTFVVSREARASKMMMFGAG